MIEFSAFEKYYNGRRIVSADVELPHSVYWLQGHNGCGKTTLINCVAGLIPFKGQIAVNGITITKDPVAYRRIVNYAEAEPGYPGFLTGQELLDFYLEAKGGDILIAKRLIADLRIGSYIRDKIGTYSSGMLKRLSLALAFIGMPRLILLDEPLITLDQASNTSIGEIIKDRYNQGTSFLITSHQALPLAGREPVPLAIESSALKHAQ